MRQRVASFVCLTCFFLLTSTTLPAKRVTPIPVQPVTSNGVTYSAPLNDGRIAYVIATDDKTGKELWKAKVFHNRINPFVEEDVQWVFISELKLAGKETLLVRDERGRCYRIDILTRKVGKTSCW